MGDSPIRRQCSKVNLGCKQRLFCNDKNIKYYQVTIAKANTNNYASLHCPLVAVTISPLVGESVGAVSVATLKRVGVVLPHYNSLLLIVSSSWACSDIHLVAT